MRERLARLGVLLLVGILTVIAYSCNNWPYHHPSDNYDTADSTYVAQFVEDIQNPNLTDVTEVLELQNQMQSNISIDSMFMSMPQDVVKNVSSVLFKKNKFIRKKDIVEEFRLHGDIYNNLPKESAEANTTSTKEVDLGTTDLGNRQEPKILSTSYKYRTDTIDGKPVKIKIKVEESYE